MKVTQSQTPSNVTAKTKSDTKIDSLPMQWWKARSKDEMNRAILSTARFLKDNQNFRQRQAAIYARLYGNVSLFSFTGSNMSRIDGSSGMPVDRPTFNLIQSAVDTLVSRISQSRPSPVFLTDNGDYKERNLAKKLNNFIQGEFYHTKAYEKATLALRDSLVEGTGVIHVYEGTDGKVALERVLLTELFVDANESYYGEPRQLYRLKLVDRQTLIEMFPACRSDLKLAEKATPDSSAESSKSIADMVMVVEAWHLPSAPGAKDGKHVISCSSCVLFEEGWEKERFPFAFLHYSPRMLGFWAQGLAEQLMGTQMEINSLLHTITRAIKLVGVPRVFVEEGSKVAGATFNNDVGAIIKYRGIKPIYEVAPAVPQEMYAQLQRLIDYGYQQCGVSFMQAASQKPAGLNSGEAIRSYDDISTDRFSTLARRYDNFFIDLAYQIVELAKEICERDGEYATVYPGKNGVKKIDLPKAAEIKNPFVIQCFNVSSLPREPAGRMQKVTEMIQSGMISIKEGRRLLDFPDLEQMELLANASEERIFQVLDQIVETGEYTPPDSFMDLQLASELAVQYYNLYASAKLEEEKCELIRTFHTQVQAIITASQPPPMDPMAAAMGGAPNAPQAMPEPLPTSPLVPNAMPQV